MDHSDERSLDSNCARCMFDSLIFLNQLPVLCDNSPQFWFNVFLLRNSAHF
jgi:hypothetical protein